MAILPIVEFPDPRLLQKTVPVAAVDDAIRGLVADMLETMYADQGVGLAANQVGVLKRIFVMDDSRDGSNPEVFINPEIVESHGEITLGEGCLSFPGIYAQITRPEFITIQALDLDGKAFTKSASDYEARCFLHELDHLNGITFLDYMTPVKRKLMLAKLQKTQGKRQKQRSR